MFVDRAAAGCVMVTFTTVWQLFTSRTVHVTSVRIDGDTHEQLKRLADELGTTVGNTVTLAVRALRQDLAGRQLSTTLLDDEIAWLDADPG